MLFTFYLLQLRKNPKKCGCIDPGYVSIYLGDGELDGDGQGAPADRAGYLARDDIADVAESAARDVKRVRMGTESDQVRVKRRRKAASAVVAHRRGGHLVDWRRQPRARTQRRRRRYYLAAPDRHSERLFRPPLDLNL